MPYKVNAADQILQTKLNPFASLVFDNSQSLRNPGVQDLSLGHRTCAQPVNDLVKQSAGYLVHVGEFLPC